MSKEMTNNSAQRLKVYYIGNELIEEDSIHIRVCEKLKGLLNDVEFIRLNDPLELLEVKTFPIVLVDSALGIKRTMVVDSPQMLLDESIVSAHFLNLAFCIKLCATMNKDFKFKAICVPANISLEDAVNEVHVKLEDIKRER
jgi:Ni,Fe-hydrogenase maturation factor